MTIRSAFYLSIAVAAARRLLDRVLRPASRKPRDILVFASPRGFLGEPPAGIRIARLPAGTPREDVTGLRTALSALLDRAHIAVTSYDLANTPLCTGWIWKDYPDVDPGSLSSIPGLTAMAVAETVHAELRGRPFALINLFT